MKAPEPSLSGNVRSRDELEEMDPCMDSDMAVDLVDFAQADVPPLSPKRRRVERGTSTNGIVSGMFIANSLLCNPIPLENI